MTSKLEKNETPYLVEINSMGFKIAFLNHLDGSMKVKWNSPYAGWTRVEPRYMPYVRLVHELTFSKLERLVIKDKYPELWLDYTSVIPHKIL